MTQLLPNCMQWKFVSLGCLPISFLTNLVTSTPAAHGKLDYFRQTLVEYLSTKHEVDCCQEILFKFYDSQETGQETQTLVR